MLDDYLKANLASWDEAVGLHVGSALYDVAGFKAGSTSLSAIELGELGPLVGEGTSLLHLQCHFGLDTLSWARRGAVVTGVDFSGEGVGRRARWPTKSASPRAPPSSRATSRACRTAVRILRRRLHLLGRAHLAAATSSAGPT